MPSNVFTYVSRLLIQVIAASAKPQASVAASAPAVLSSKPPSSSFSFTSVSASSTSYARPATSSASAPSHYGSDFPVESSGVQSAPPPPPPPSARDAYKSVHMGMTDAEARLVESQQRGYDYDKQQQNAKLGIKPPSQQKKHIRTNSIGATWEDPTLMEWPENDYRLFCGDLGNEITDDLLTRTFSKYPSFAKVPSLNLFFFNAPNVPPFSLLPIMYLAHRVSAHFFSNRPHPFNSPLQQSISHRSFNIPS